MRLTCIVLGLLCLLPAAIRAESAVDLTQLFPQDAHFTFRIKSLDRLDAITREMIPLLRQLGATEEADMLGKAPLSTIAGAESGINLEWLDRKKPVYMVAADPRKGEVMVVANTAAGVTWEGEKELKNGAVAVQRGSTMMAGLPPSLQLAPSNKPTKMLEGDLVFHAYAANLNRIYKEQIDAGFAMGTMRAAGMPLPPVAQKMIAPIMKSIQGAVQATTSIGYALTWKGDHALGHGLIATDPASNFHAMLKKSGPAGASQLARYLPGDAIFMFDLHAAPGWPLADVGAAAGGEAGQGKLGAAILRLLSLSSAFSESLTGESAGSLAMAGMMGANITSIAKLKQGVDVSKMFDKLDVAAMNKEFADLNIPLTFEFKKNILKHGEINMHQLVMQSNHPNIAMVAGMMQHYIAAGHGHLIAVMSPTGADDVRTLLDRISAGKARDSLHLKQMDRFGRARTMGLTLNVSALKQVLMTFAMMAPEMAKLANAIPDDLAVSTAVTTSNGNIEWKGNWPLGKFAAIAEVMNGGGAKPKSDDEEFD